MRTTLAIDDHVLEAAKVAARKQGTTVGKLVEDVLRQALSAPPAASPPPVPTFTKGTGVRPGVDLRSNRALAELLDAPAGAEANHRR